ncbi:hypothetical protein FGADI_11040 [Fusarium gaditjirri]|uniref:Uncharacterized protein n=1 Tax=Fusarium gaditjirri TaxID=282569 RepID=A0A8H4WQT3_9HYPO|nr:hypothetical protein FGADI_11040 [Fusarium gaditjirri]
MVYAVGVGGTTATILILVMLFCLTDPSGIVATSTGMPIVELILQATGSRAGTTFLTLMLETCFIHGTNGSITSASRLLYAMARDQGTLYHEDSSHIHRRWEVPVRTFVLTWVFNAIFGLLYLGPTVAFNAFISSFLLLPDCPASRRQLNESISLPLFSYLHADSRPDYVSAVIGIFAIVLTGYWALYGKKTFQGPDLDVILGERLDLVEATDELATEEKKVESPTK